MPGGKRHNAMEFGGVDEADQLVDDLKKKSDNIEKKLKQVVLDNYGVCVSSCKEVQRLDSELPKVGSLLGKFREELTSLSNMTIVDHVSKTTEGTSIDGTAAAEGLETETPDFVDSRFAAVASQFVERKFFEAADCLAALDDVKDASTAGQDAYQHEEDKWKRKLSAVFLSHLDNTCPLSSERRRILSQLVRLGQTEAALHSFFDFNFRQQLDRARHYQASAGTGDVCQYTRDLVHLTVIGILEVVKQFRRVFMSPEECSKRGLWSRMVTWAKEDMHRLAVLLIKMISDTSITSLSSLCECIPVIFAQLTPLDKEGLSLSFVLEKYLAPPLLLRLQHVFEQTKSEITSFVADDTLDFTELQDSMCPGNITCSLARLYSLMPKLIGDTIVLVPESGGPYPYISSLLSPEILNGLICILEHYIEVLADRARHSHSTLSDEQHFAVLANLKSIARDLTHRLNQVISSDVPHCDMTFLTAFRQRAENQFRTHAHFVAQCRPAFWLQACVAWPPYTSPRDKNNSIGPSLGIQAFVDCVQTACLRFSKVLDENFAAKISSNCCLDVARALSSRKTWLLVQRNTFTVDNVDQIVLDLKFVEKALCELIEPSAEAIFHHHLQRAVDAAVVRCDQRIDRDLETIERKDLQNFLSQKSVASHHLAA